MVVLYSHERKDRDVRLGTEQLGWLAEDLAANELPVVVLMHHSAADQDLRGNRWFESAAHICLVADRIHGAEHRNDDLARRKAGNDG